MKWIDWIRGKEVPQASNNPTLNYQVVTSNSSGSKEITPETALQNPTVFACVQLLASTISGMNWAVASKGQSGFNPIDHEVNELLKRPNDAMTSHELKFQIVIDLLTYGNCYLLKVRAGNRVISLVPLSPRDIEQKVSATGKRTYQHKAGKVYTDQDIILIRDFIGGSSLGLSRVRQAAQLVNIDNAIDGQMAGSFEGGSNISGVVSFPESVEPEIKQAFAEAWKANFGRGGANKGSIAVLDGGATFTQVKSMTAVDSDLMNLKQQTMSRIAAIFRVPSVNINIFDGAKYNNYSQQQTSFYRDAIKPIANNIAKKLTFALINDDKLEIEFDDSDLIKGDMATATNVAIQAVASNIITVNEARELIGYPERDGLDKTGKETEDG